jgi:hypothetical protein
MLVGAKLAYSGDRGQSTLICGLFTVGVIGVLPITGVFEPKG